MSLLSSLSRKLLVSSMAGVLALGGVPVAAAATPSASGESSQVHGALGPLGALTDLAVQRILLGDKVAAAKFGTDQPIDDPVREQQVLDSVTAMSLSLGLDAGVSVRFFRDQIDANKVVQRGLYALWTAHPELRPTERPDLTTEVRPELDRITTEVLQQLRATVSIRHASISCLMQAALAKVSAEVSQRLDSLHRDALTVALRSVCSS